MLHKWPIPFTRFVSVAIVLGICALGGYSTSENAPSADLVIFLTGGSGGYLEECGCQVRQSGGLAKRIGLIKSERAKHPPGKTLFVDAGGFTAGQTVFDQEKTAVIVRAMGEGGCDLINVGEEDRRFGSSFLQRLAGESSAALLASNTPTKGHFVKPIFRSKVGEVSVLFLGFTAQTPKEEPPPSSCCPGSGRQHKEQPQAGSAEDSMLGVADDLPVEPYEQALQKALTREKKPSDVVIILSDLTHEQNRDLAMQHSGDITLILGARSGRFSESIAGVPIVRAEGLGSGVGKVEIRFDAKERKIASLDAQNLAVAQNLPEDEATRKIIGTFYERVEKDPKFAPFAKSRLSHLEVESLAGNTYTGTEKCAKCHEVQYAFWKTTKHAQAFRQLLAKQRHFIPECISCHSVGYGDPRGYTRAGRTDHLRNVGCEVCHGPGYKHMVKGTSEFTRKSPGEELCRSCHDALHDPGFSQERLEAIRCPKEE